MMKITVVDLLAASKLLRMPSSNKDWQALVSIGDPESRYPKGFQSVQKRLRLEFEDIDTAIEEDYSEPTDIPPVESDIAKLISFFESLQEQEGNCLIHCHAGVSRSPGASFIGNCVWMGPGKEDEAMKAALEGCEKYWVFPNDLMVKMADHLMGRHGKMNECLYQNSKSNERMY
jgi:predicted protein tyrosine phosphatase